MTVDAGRGLEADSLSATAADEPQASFDEFYAREYQRAVRLAYVLCGRRDVAEELAQDAFVALLRRWRRISAFDRPDLWLRRVLLHNSVSAWRRRTTELRLVARLGRERPEQLAIDDSDDRVWCALRCLPARQRDVLLLTALDGRTAPDIGLILDCSENTVRTHLMRARRSLADVLGEEGPTE
ncbi:MAG: putative polymerase subfamily sigma factor [Actinomycetia bacterium]|nr:putative polymerase subfamily sigma factor [Actinomycetes bacterium]